MINFLFGRNKDDAGAVQLRDTLCTKEYFDGYIREESERAKKFRDNIASGTLAADRVSPVKQKLCTIELNLLTAKYSRGLSADDLKKEFLQTAESIDESCISESYDDDLRLLSLCVLFDAGNEVKDRIADLIKAKGGYDCMTECLSSGVLPKESSLKFPGVYGELWDMLCKNDTEGIRRYLQNKWYKSHSYAYWYDAHKAKEKLYFGYWAFETAALMKVLGINAESLKDVECFPYELYCY